MVVTIYTRQFCSYCVRAKSLLVELGVAIKEIPVDRDANAYQEMRERSGRTSVPQIWVGQVHIGGCDELMALHKSGQLIGLLG